MMKIIIRHEGQNTDCKVAGINSEWSEAEQ